MWCRTLCAVLLSSSLFAQDAPTLRTTMRDGSSIETAVDLSADVDVIVELRDPPLAVQRLPLETYQANFARLRRDAAFRQGKTAIEPEIHREFFEVFHGTAMRVPRAQLDAIRALPYVKRVHRDVPMRALTETNIETVGAPKTWSTLGTRGLGVTVAIIDTGIDYTHPALRGNFSGGWDFVNNDGDPMDDQGHGTHVAGIVAANLDSFTGVAPDAKLVAYKVLNSRGQGRESDVIAGIERALDPNGDGDFSDHAAVANLSLGGEGNPDDAASIAVDNAVAAGMVMCVAAGNSGAFHAVASPGTARNAITVGAVDNRDVLAPFSSKGPAAKLAMLKPDVVAPGVAIRSTYLAGGYAVLSGTSMATPHVTGAAALLRAIHPDWSPAEVKSALVLYAKAINEEQMSQGGGRIDIARAANATILTSPASISFGLDTQSSGTLSKIETIHITNRGMKSESIALSVDGAQHGVSIAIDPPKLVLAAGASADATLILAVTNDDTAPLTTDSYSFSGFVHIDTTSTQTHLPWALVKASRATVVTDMNLFAQYWIGAARTPFAVYVDQNATETLLPPGDYDLLLASTQGAVIPTSESIVVLDHQSIRGDVTINANAALATHTITFDGLDVNGVRLRRPSSWVLRERIVPPAGSYVTAIDLPMFNLPSLRVSDVSSRWTIAAMETLFDRDHATFTQVSHPALHAIASDIDLMNAPQSLRHAPVRLTSNRVVTVSSVVGTRGVSSQVNTNALELFMTPPDPALPSAFSLTSDFFVPSIGARGDRIDIGSAYSAADGETLSFGTGPVHPRMPVAISNSLLAPPFGFIGQLGEYRTPFDAAGYFTVTNANGSIVATGTPLTNAFYLAPGKYTIDYVALMNAVRAEVVATIDTTFGDASAPVLTSMYVADATGRAVSKLAPFSAATLRFAADVASAKAWSRSGGGTWTELPLAIDGDHRYHADLATNAVAAIDLRIELTGASGDQMTWSLAPAFTVGDVAQLPRRRP